ncbi:CST complex subunit CTC1 [Xenentodon cancila]
MDQDPDQSLVPDQNGDSLQVFVEQFRPSSEAESVWLKNIFTYVSLHLNPVSCGPAPSTADGSLTGVGGEDRVHQLSVSLVQKIREKTSISLSLPVSYRLLSVSELVSQQRLACVSNLSWSTNQQRAWAKEAELSLPGQAGVLPRVNLLLIGCLREGRGGEWRLTDSSGSVRCELESPSPLWLNRPVFLPHWNYIPHDAPGQDREGGHVELVGPPVYLCPAADQQLAADVEGGAELSRAVGVREAKGFLSQSRVRGQRVSVYGEVDSVCPPLVVGGTSFFCFTLMDQSTSLPVLVKESGLWWSRCVRVGQSVCVTSLRVCVLRGWRGNNILCVTERSQIHTDYTSSHTLGETHTPVHDTHSQHDTPLLMMVPPDDWEEAGPEEDPSGVRMKRSRVISYQGTVTEVVSEGAGLYVIDRKVGLCLAYQPSVRRNLRAGDQVELHHIHFLYRPSPDFPPSMLCSCLRSTVQVTSFSRVGGSVSAPRCPGDRVLPRLLLQKNTGVSEYLWTCHLSSQLSHSLVPGVLKQQCVCLLSWKLMETLWRQQGGGRRDIYSEMLDEPHTCPLTRYIVDPALHQYLSVSELLQSLQSICWSSLSLRSLLGPDGSGLSRSEISLALSWSCRTLSSDPRRGDGLRPRPLFLVGVLELPRQTSDFKQSLQLRDATGGVACVIADTRNEEKGCQTPSLNTAWIGCLVCVLQFTMVTERFLQSEFPSYQHLDQDQFITHRRCRVYLQFSLDHVHIISPSFTMETHLREEPREKTKRGKKRRSAHTDPPFSPSVATTTAPLDRAPMPCVSLVIRVEQKEGVVGKNTGVGTPMEGEGLVLCFSLRAAVIGPVVNWGLDPKNRPITNREVEQESQERVLLVFSGACARWFPVLQPGCFYRVVSSNNQDLHDLIVCGVSGRSGVELHTDSTIQVKPDWRVHTLTRPLLHPTCPQVVSPAVLSVSEVLDCRSELVSFQGLVSERITVRDRSSDSGVRLTMFDQTGRSLQVYLNLRHTPYLPGLLPGNTLLLYAFQRRCSRSGGVYCSNLPVSCITVMSLGDVSCAPPPPAPIMHLGQWAVSSEHRCMLGKIRGHVVCFLFLQLQWSCSTCGSLYTQVCSSRCGSSAAVFQSKAKLVIEDGTGEAHVLFSGVLVRSVLGLADSQWEGLQRALRPKGVIRFYPRGRSLVCDRDSDDPLLHFLSCVCSSDVVCRPISFTCRRRTSHRSEEPSTSASMTRYRSGLRPAQGGGRADGGGGVYMVLCPTLSNSNREGRSLRGSMSNP